MNFFEQVEAVAIRQADVEEQQVKGMLFELGQAGLSGAGAGDSVGLRC